MDSCSSDRAVLREPEAAVRDRELLELAALAYWGDEIDDVCSIRWLEEDQAIGYTHGDNQDHNGIDQEYLWNPLEDDGDALRLAVKLHMTVRCYMGNTCAQVAVPGQLYADAVETDHDDPAAATRLAIVRAAAQIGSELLKTASGCSHTAEPNEQDQSGSSHV